MRETAYQHAIRKPTIEDVIGKTVAMIDASEGHVLIIRFTDSTYLEVNSTDGLGEVETWYDAHIMHGRADA